MRGSWHLIFYESWCNINCQLLEFLNRKEFHLFFPLACSCKNSDCLSSSTFCKPIAIDQLRARSSTPGSPEARHCSNSLYLSSYGISLIQIIK